MDVKRAKSLAKAKEIERRVAQQLAKALTEHLSIDIDIRSVDARSDAAWTGQWRPFLAVCNRAPPEGGWEWPTWTSLTQKDSKKIGFAIWQGDVLCGLAYGTKSKNNVKIIMLESDPLERYKGNSIDILLIFTLLFEVYCEEVGLNFVELVDPAERLIPKYEDLEYRLVPGAKAPRIMRKEV